MSTNSLLLNLIVSLHQRGFVDDIELAGDEFFCVQQKTFVQLQDLSILERYRVHKKGRRKEDKMVFGLSAESLGVKGILIIDFNVNIALMHTR
jgi:hypothetical protein